MAKLKIEGYIGYPEGMEILSDQPFFNLQKLDDWLAENKDKDVTLEINSGGGSVREGWAMFDRLKASGRNITSEVLGMCGSIATIFLLVAPKGQRKAHKNSKGFIHNPYWQPMNPDPIEADDAKQLEKDLRDEEKRILDFYAKETGSETSALQKYMKDKTELNAEEMKALGFVDEVIGAEVTAQKKFHVMAFHEPREKKNLSNQDKSWFGAKIAKLEKLLAEKLNPIKNMTAKLKDGSEIFVASEDDMWVGKKAFKDDQSTPLVAGEYTLEDNRVVIVDEAGVITEVKAPMPDAVAALKKELAEAKAELSKLKKAENDKETEALKTELEEIKNYVNELTGKAPGKGKQNFKGEEENTPLTNIKRNLIKFKENIQTN